MLGPGSGVNFASDNNIPQQRLCQPAFTARCAYVSLLLQLAAHMSACFYSSVRLCQPAFTARKMIYYRVVDLWKLKDSKHVIRMTDCHTRVINARAIGGIRKLRM